MKSKCNSCEEHHINGKRHTCDKCPGKSIVGDIQPDMMFIPYCNNYKPNTTEIERLNILKKIKKIEDEKFRLEESPHRKRDVIKSLIEEKNRERCNLINQLRELLKNEN